MGLRDRIGIDISRRMKLEDGIESAAQHEAHFIDIYSKFGAPTPASEAVYTMVKLHRMGRTQGRSALS